MDGEPFVSVVMAVRDEAPSIAMTLSAVLDQEYPADRYEVLIADGRSSDGTVAAIEATVDASTRGVSVAVLDNADRTASAGLNTALARAKGDVVVRVDGRSVIAPNYLRACVDALAVTGADNVGGVQRVRVTTGTRGAIAVATTSRFGVGNAPFRSSAEPAWVDSVYLGAYRRGVFDRVGTFDPELVHNQDDEFNLRLREAGGRIWLDPAIRVFYEPRATYGRLARQYFNYGLYKVRVMQKRGGVSAWRHLVPPALVAGLLLACALTAVTRDPRFVASVAMPYAVANAFAALAATAGSRRLAPRVSVAFAVLHFAYGAGVLAGLWRWRAFFARR